MRKHALLTFRLGKAVFAIIRRYQTDLVLWIFERIGADSTCIADSNRKRDQSRWYVNVLKSAGHGILAANGRRAKVNLRLQRAQQRRQRLAPGFRRAGHALEVLLKGQMDIVAARSGRHQLGNGVHHREISAAIGALLADIGIKAVGHHGCGIAFLALYADSRSHGLHGRQLTLSAEGHEQAARAIGRVKPLGQTALRALVQIDHGLFYAVRKRDLSLFCDIALFNDMGSGGLGRAIGIQEFALDVHDGFSIPMHDQTGLSGHRRHSGGFNVLALRDGFKFRHVLRRKHHGHALLRFGDGQLGAVQSVVFLRNFAQIDVQTVGKLADGDGHAAGAKVVAPLDHARRALISEQALKLALLRRVALLNLCAAGGQRFGGMRLA